MGSNKTLIKTDTLETNSAHKKALLWLSGREELFL